jgi:hypothetical protein
MVGDIIFAGASGFFSVQDLKHWLGGGGTEA